MFDSMYIAATGMMAGQSSISTLSNNLANLNTVAFKKSRVTFDDIFYRDVAAMDASRTFTGLSSQVGLGSSIGEIQRLFDKGALSATSNAMDVAIDGKGFLEIAMPNGEYAYTRNGTLQVGSDGFLETKDGYRLSAMISVPKDVSTLTITNDGKVTGQVTDTNETLNLGQIEVADFINEGGLKAIGNGVYLSTDNSGSVFYSLPGENSTGQLQQGFLEASNVDLVSELMDMVVAQQMFSANSQVVKTADRLMQTVNTLRQ